MYRANWASATTDEDRKAFERDLGDSLSELRFLIEQFDKFGVPKSVTHVALPAKAHLAAPEKVTVRWLVDNVPMLLWAGFVGLLFASFSIGFTLAQSEVSRKFVTFIVGLFGAASPPR